MRSDLPSVLGIEGFDNLACWARTEPVSGCSKMTRTRVETHGQAISEILVSRLRW